MKLPNKFEFKIAGMGVGIGLGYTMSLDSKTSLYRCTWWTGGLMSEKYYRLDEVSQYFENGSWTITNVFKDEAVTEISEDTTLALIKDFSTRITQSAVTFSNGKWEIYWDKFSCFTLFVDTDEKLAEVIKAIMVIEGAIVD